MSNDAIDPFDSIVFRRTPGAPFTSDASSASVAFSSGKKSPKQVTHVKLFIHEEVASTQDKKNSLDEISSHVLLDGTVEVSWMYCVYSM